MKKMSRKWTKKEDELLKKLYPNVVTNQIVKHFDLYKFQAHRKVGFFLH